MNYNCSVLIESVIIQVQKIDRKTWQKDYPLNYFLTLWTLGSIDIYLYPQHWASHITPVPVTTSVWALVVA